MTTDTDNTDDTHDQTHESLMDSAMSLVEDTPDMIGTIIESLEQTLIPLFEDAHARGDTATCTAIDGIWQQIQTIHQLAISQALGVASVGIVAVSLRMQRNEAYHKLAEANEVIQQIAKGRAS